MQKSTPHQYGLYQHNGRFVHVDAAKGIAIILLLSWHTIGDSIYINSLLKLLRMPLFFFASGLFAAKALDMGWGDFFKSRIFQLIYIFFIWSYIVWASAFFLDIYFGREPSALQSPAQLLINPPLTMWFVYALAITYIVVRSFRFLPPVALFILSFVLYCIDLSINKELFDVPFWERVVRLLPFFIVALHMKDLFHKLITKYCKFWIFGLLIYIYTSHLILSGFLPVQGPIVFVCGIFGILSVLAFCFHCKGNFFLIALSWIGARTIFIYVMHRAIIPYIYAIYGKLLWYPEGVWGKSFVAIATLSLCLVIGEFLVRPYLPWLEKAPWLHRRVTKTL